MGEKIANGVYVREYFQVPAHIGSRVAWRGNLGTIVGFDLAYLRVELDADPLEGDPEEVVVHPRWEVQYDPAEKPASATGRRRVLAAPDPGSDPARDGTVGGPGDDESPAADVDGELRSRTQEAA